VSEAKAANRSGLEAQSSVSFSFCSFTICPARSRSLPYQKGLIDSTSMSTGLRSMAGEPLVDLDEGLGCDVGPRASVDERGRGGSAGALQCDGFAELAMGVHVDRFDPFATDHDG